MSADLVMSTLMQGPTKAMLDSWLWVGRAPRGRSVW